LAIAEFSEALQIIPKVLAMNAAKDATELLGIFNGGQGRIARAMFGEEGSRFSSHPHSHQ